MKRVDINPVTPQRKLMAIAKKFDNKGLKFQQGTTKVIYDTLPLDGRSNFRFFEEASTRAFPFTNQGADGNKLPVGNALVIERAYLSVVQVDANSGDIVFIAPMSLLGNGALQAAELEIAIANSVTMKQVPVLSFEPEFNKSATHEAYNNFEFDTQIVIQPLLEFNFNLRTATYVPILNTQLRLTVEGAGAIISPRNPM